MPRAPLRRLFYLVVFFACILPILYMKHLSNLLPRDETAEPLFKLNPETKTYEIQGKPIIWQFWDKDEVPVYVLLLVEAMQCRNPEFKTILVHDSTIYRYLPNLDLSEDIFTALTPNHKADVFRAAILHQYGGVYVDTDSYALDKYYPLYRLLENYDLVTADWESEKALVAISSVGPSRAGVSFFRVWYKNQIDLIRWKWPEVDNSTGTNTTEPPYPISYLELSGVAGAWNKEVNAEITSNRTNYRAFNGHATAGQLLVDGAGNFIGRGSPDSLWSEHNNKILPLNWAPLLFLYGRSMHKIYSKITAIDQLIKKPETSFTVFVGCALFDCWNDYLKLEKAEETPKSAFGLNVTELMVAMQRMNRSICDSVRKELKFDFEKFSKN